MKIKIFSAMVIITIIITACDSKSHIVFDSTSHDFGKVKPESTLIHTFGFKNTGKTTLVIERIKAG